MTKQITMRELLFRGKLKDNGEWIEGYGVCIINEESLASIIHKQGNNLMQNTEVIPETVGQYTGLTDKNGTKIFEGDLFLSNEVSEVLWNNRLASFVVLECGERIQLNEYDLNEVLIIGNIHENKEQC